MRYSKKTGRMGKCVSKQDQMTTAELAIYLKTLAGKPSEFSRCPVCDREKSKDYKFCKACEKKGKKFRRDTLLGKARKHSAELAKKARLPRKNRKKGRIITNLMSPRRAHESQAATEPTTVIRRNLYTQEYWHNELLAALFL